MLFVVGLCIAVAGCGDNLTQPPEHDPYDGGGGAGALACVPNLDGKIEAAELETALGVPLHYLVSPAGEERAVDVAGAAGADGLTWTFSADYASDQVATLAAAGLAGKWYQASFPGGEFATPIDAAGTIEGVYASSDEAITLLGIASRDEAPPEGKTLVVYDTPIAVFALPLEPGKTWVSTGEVTNAVVRGLPYAGKDIYEVADDATGTIVLRDYTFTQAHRVRTKVTLSPAVGAPTFTRQVSFMFECFGEVARVKSRPDEPLSDFTTAAELRRLGQ